MLENRFVTIKVLWLCRNSSMQSFNAYAISEIISETRHSIQPPSCKQSQYRIHRILWGAVVMTSKDESNRKSLAIFYQTGALPLSIIFHHNETKTQCSGSLPLAVDRTDSWLRKKYDYLEGNHVITLFSVAGEEFDIMMDL